MTTLSEIHSAIKNHPFRLENDFNYYEDYSYLLYDLSHEFYLHVKTHPLYYFTKEMCHDFLYAVRTKKIEHIERCLMVIHLYIDTGEIPTFYTLYEGVNILKSFNRIRKFVYDPDWKNNYRPIYTEQEVNNSIIEIEEYWNSNQDLLKKHHGDLVYSPYSKYHHQYLIDYRKKVYRK